MQVNMFGNHLDKENPKAEGKGKEVGRVPESTNRMGGGDQPGRHREEEHEDGEEEEQAHGLVANQGALPHLHHHIVEDEQAEQDAQGAEGEEGKSPGASQPQGGCRHWKETRTSGTHNISTAYIVLLEIQRVLRPLNPTDPLPTLHPLPPKEEDKEQHKQHFSHKEESRNRPKIASTFPTVRRPTKPETGAQDAPHRPELAHKVFGYRRLLRP